MTRIDNGNIQYRDEVVRKSIHLFSLSIPIVYYFITKELALKILIPMTLLFLLVDLGRYISPQLAKLFYLFNFLLRDHERDNKKKTLNGATYVLLSAVICVFAFPKIFFITAFSVLIISDSAAALIGRKFGRHRFLSKSLEGTLAFFITACIVVMLTPKLTDGITEYLIGFVAVGIGAIAENISYGWADDNLSIPISIGSFMWLLYLIFLPNLSLVLSQVPN